MVIPGIEQVFAAKAWEMGVGWGITLLFGIIGVYGGKPHPQVQPFAPETLVSSRKIVLAMVLGILIAGGLIALDRETYFLYWVGGYFSQALLILARSLTCLLMAYSWTRSEPSRRKTLILSGGLVILIGLTILEGYLLWPIAASLGPGRLDRCGVVRQTTGTTCSPASLANIMRLYGIPLSEHEAALFMQTSEFGSYANETIRGARAVGFPEADLWRTDLTGLASEDQPLVLLVKLFGSWDRHAVALVGMSSSSLIIADPLRGLVEEPKASFHNEWRGNAIRLGKPGFTASRTVSLARFNPRDLQY